VRQVSNHNHRQERHQHTDRDLWTQRDQNQHDDRLSHCCGHCQDSPLGDVGQGLI
jgi:hypothetical protein